MIQKQKRENHFRSALRPWCSVTRETTNLCTLERKTWKERRGREKEGMLVALCIAMLRLREAGSSQDLHASIIYKVVLRYANMNYLTSRPASLSLSLYRSTLLSILTPFLKCKSPLRTASFSWKRLRWISWSSAGFLSLPLCRVFLPLFIDFLLFNYIHAFRVGSLPLYLRDADSRQMDFWWGGEQSAHEMRHRKSLWSLGALSLPLFIHDHRV